MWIITRGYAGDPDEALWLDYSGTTDLPYGESITVKDGRRDGREGANGAEANNELPQDLNPELVQAYGVSRSGVTTTAQNLFNSRIPTQPVCVIPTGEAMTVTIVYDVETTSANLPGYISDGTTHGVSIENRITKTIDFGTATAGLQNGKKYTINLHLGMNSVKFDAVVEEWVEVWNGGSVAPETPAASDPDQNIYISSPEELAWVSQQVAGGNTFADQTLVLTTDIDLNNMAWTPIGNNTTSFEGTFDGNGKTIYNLNVNSTEDNIGLFGHVTSATIKNVTINHARLTSTRKNVAALVGGCGTQTTLEGNTVKDVEIHALARGAGILGQGYVKYLKDNTAEDITIVVTPALDGTVYDDGDKAGAIVAQLTTENAFSEMSGNTAKNFSITAYRDAGGIMGCAATDQTAEYVIKNNKAEDGTITISSVGYTPYAGNTASGNAGAIYGRNALVWDDTNTASNVEVNLSFTGFNQLLVANNGVYSAPEGSNVVVTLNASERSTRNNQTAQFYLGRGTGEQANGIPEVSVSNVTFSYNHDADDGTNVLNTGEVYAVAKDITFKNCTFINNSGLSSWGYLNSNIEYPNSMLVESCTFKGLTGRYGVHQNRAKKLTVKNCVFENCERGIHTNSLSPESVIITNNTFTGIGDRFGVVCLAEADYTNGATFNISYNSAPGQRFMRLPVTDATNVTYAQMQTIMNDSHNTYGEFYVVGGNQPAP